MDGSVVEICLLGIQTVGTETVQVTTDTFPGSASLISNPHQNFMPFEGWEWGGQESLNNLLLMGF